MYLGKPQQNNTLKIASQSPTKGDPNKLYYEFTNVPEAVKKSMFELAPNNVGDKATLAFDFTQPFETYDLERLLFDDETVKKLFPSKTKPNYEAEFLTQ